MVGIADRSIAFAFDLRCGEYLVEFDAERHQQQIEAMGISSIATAFGGVSGGMVDRSSPVALDA